MIEQISQTILRKIEERAKAESKEESIAYRRACPRCMRWQVKETLLKQGCYACGWKPKGREEDEGK